MRLAFTGFGVWSPGLTNWPEFVDLARNAEDRIQPTAGEKPQPRAIPPRERRRASLLINLAVEVLHQACDNAQQDKTSVASVFSSTMSDTQITDYMCAKLTEPAPLLSPTKFHNSVHNAASGYWTISTGNRTPSTFVSGFNHSFGSGLLEAASLAWEREAPVALVAYDVANEYPLRDICPITQTLGIAIVMDPDSAQGTMVQLQLAPGTVPPATCRHGQLSELGRANPMGEGLALLEACACVQIEPTAQAAPLAFATGGQSHLLVSVGQP